MIKKLFANPRRWCDPGSSIMCLKPDCPRCNEWRRSMTKPDTSAVRTIFPRAIGASKAGGWILDFKFIQSVCWNVYDAEQGNPQMEDVEAILLATEKVLTVPHDSREGKKG